MILPEVNSDISWFNRLSFSVVNRCQTYLSDKFFIYTSNISNNLSTVDIIILKQALKYAYESQL